MKPRAWPKPGKQSTTEPFSQSLFLMFSFCITYDPCLFLMSGLFCLTRCPPCVPYNFFVNALIPFFKCVGNTPLCKHTQSSVLTHLFVVTLSFSISWFYE